MRTSRTPEPEKSPSDPLVASRPDHTTLPIAPLPDHISKNIDAIVALQKNAHGDIPRHQRVVEAVTAFFGRPAFLYGILLVVALWTIPNALPRRFGFRQFDPPPFYWLQGAVGLSALLVTTGVLIKQDRQEKLAEQRAQLSLQLSLLSEQKIAKLIDLLEELRCDLPNVKNRYDSEAELMKQAADPHMVISALEETLEKELVELQSQEQSGESPN